MLAAFLLLRGVAFAATWAARELPRAKDARLRLAQSNIARPGSLAPALILSIGVTVSLLVALALVEGAIHAELARSGTGEIPRFYFIDVPRDESAAFESFLAQQVPAPSINHVPMMRGRIVAVKGARVETLHVGEDAAWALDGDRGDHLRRAGSARRADRRGRMVGRGYEGAAGLAGSEGGEGSGARHRRRDHGQCSRPRNHRARRQSAARRMAQLRH